MNWFSKSYYKFRIILTFTIVTVLIVITLSRISYLFVRNLYLEQVSEQVVSLSGIIAKQINQNQLDLLQVGIPPEFIDKEYKQYFGNFNDDKSLSEIFIFNNRFEIIVHSEKKKILGTPDPRLFINQKEILDLHKRQAIASLPFKGDDNKWYLWGFYKLDEQLWLAVRESASRLEKVENFSSIFWIVGILGCLITVLLGWIAARSITKPINKLINFSSEIGKGNLKFNRPEGFHGEIGVLANAMDVMRMEIMNNQKEKENILAQIAHEIRNPLGGIELLTNLTKEDLVKEQKNVDYLDKILNEINKLKSLITSYLNYSRPLPSSPEWVELDNIFVDIYNIFKSRICDKNIELLFNGDLKNIYFDPVHLRNVLVNLVSNSLEAVKDNGRIEVNSEIIENNWVISVNDNGPGIKAENHSRVFEPFFTTKKDGTGLGLAISKKLCEENNSSLSLNLNQAGGSVFTISKEIIYENK